MALSELLEPDGPLGTGPRDGGRLPHALEAASGVLRSMVLGSLIWGGLIWTALLTTAV